MGGEDTQFRSKQEHLYKLQKLFLDLRFGMFIHFNMATYQNLEWGDPTAPPSMFSPGKLDTNQWLSAAKSAGMTYSCLTTKHHDGFAIWPTRTGGACVEGVDVVRSYVDSCHKAEIRVGLYYSILDLRADIRKFCITPEKVAFIKEQLTELLTDYGPIDLLVFDGWNAPWSRITYEDISFEDIYTHVKSLQSDCLVMDLNAGEFPAAGFYYTDIKSFESNAGELLPNENILPAQACFTLTNEWFWKEGDNKSGLKSTKQVVEEWLNPLNQRFCNILLNTPPDRDGKLSPNILKRLQEIGKAWKPKPLPLLSSSLNITTPNLTLQQPIYASASRDTFGPDLINDGVFQHSWTAPPNHPSCWIEIDLTRQGLPATFNTVILYEPVGRWSNYPETRISSYRFSALIEGIEGGQWVEIVRGTISKKQEMRLQVHSVRPIRATRIRLDIRRGESTPEPHIADIGVYNEPI